MTYTTTPAIGFTSNADGDTRSQAQRSFDERVESRKQDIYGDESLRAKYALRYLSSSDRVYGTVHSIIGQSAWLKQSPEDLFDLWLDDVVSDELRQRVAA
jgi:hypothetical protein